MVDDDKQNEAKKRQKSTDYIWKSSNERLYSKFFANYFLEKSTPSLFSELASLFSKSAREQKRSLEEQKHLLVKQLLESDIDPVAFDVLLSNEINRRLKVRFGVAFLVLTLLFTIGSYAIVIFDGILKWGISEIAITALIIETPIQFVGLLYIIARNLFPSSSGEVNESQSGLKIEKSNHKKN